MMRKENLLENTTPLATLIPMVIVLFHLLSSLLLFVKILFFL